MALCAKRQIERHWVVTASRKSVVFVETLGGLCLCIDNQSIGGNVFACLQAAFNRTTDQKPTQSAALVFCICSESAHTETGDRVTW